MQNDRLKFKSVNSCHCPQEVTLLNLYPWIGVLGGVHHTATNLVCHQPA